MKLLITEPFKPTSTYSCVYKLGDESEDNQLRMIDYRPEHKLMAQNNTHLCNAPLPPELKDMILEILIDTTLQNRQIPLALTYIFVNSYHVNRFYNRFFDITETSTSACILRISALLNLFRDTDDWLIDAARHPIGFNNMSIHLGETIHDLKPWSYEGEFEIQVTPQPTVLFPEAYSKTATMRQILTGPFHTQTIWVGGTAHNGIVNVEYYKNPVIVYCLCNIDFVGSEELDVGADFFMEPEWEGFGVLARLIFGYNAGIFFHINRELPDELVFTAPVIFEV